jgi:Family of unknown function (DUF6150)
MKPLVLLIILVLTGDINSDQQIDYCHLRGSVYIAEDRSRADFIVYEEESEAFADFLVYEEENRLYATEDGIWFFVENRGIADFSIYLTKSKGEAHFVIAYTDSPTFAGCD